MPSGESCTNCCNRWQNERNVKSAEPFGTCALHAPTASSVRIRSIRAEDAVGANNTDGSVFLYEIVDCARMAFHPCTIDDSRGQLLVHATSQLRNNGDRDLRRHA